MRLEATHLQGMRYAVRPEGTLGTHGFIDGVGWEVEYVCANNARSAVHKVLRLRAARLSSVLGRPHLAVDQDSGEFI